VVAQPVQLEAYAMLKFIKRLIKLSLLAGAVYAGYKLARMYMEPSGQGEYTGTTPPISSVSDTYEVDLSKLGGQVSQDLLDILVCPLDKGALELVDGKWLVNRRNGYRYPIIDGIPVMLVEVGEKYKDESLIQQSEPTGDGSGPAE
jgi:uncharacterized protein YbaR (Trm112 family)